MRQKQKKRRKKRFIKYLMKNKDDDCIWVERWTANLQIQQMIKMLGNIYKYIFVK